LSLLEPIRPVILFFWEVPFFKRDAVESQDGALLVASFIIAYFLGLTYAISRAGTYFGLEYSAFLVLAAAGFGTFAVRHKTRLGATFLVFFNASRIFFMIFGVAYFLNTFGIVGIALNKADFFGYWVFPFGLLAILNVVYVLGFSDRKQKYIFFSWIKDSSNSEIHRF